MKAFAFWLAGFVVVFAIYALVTNVVRGTDRVFVVVDSSFAMGEVWNQIPAELDAIDNQRASEFALATEKDRVHGWLPQLSLTRVTPYAPCDFDDIEGYSEVTEADTLILITTSASCDTRSFTRWKIVLLQPTRVSPGG